MNKKRISFREAITNGALNDMVLQNLGNIAKLNHEVLKEYMKKIVCAGNTHLEIDLSGVHNIDNEWFDTFNFLSRLAKKYGSQVTLTGVESEVMEIIELIRKYYFFDIREVQPV